MDDTLKWWMFCGLLAAALWLEDHNDDVRQDQLIEVLTDHITNENQSSTLTLMDDPIKYNMSPGDTIPK